MTSACAALPAALSETLSRRRSVGGFVQSRRHPDTYGRFMISTGTFTVSDVEPVDYAPTIVTALPTGHLRMVKT